MKGAHQDGEREDEYLDPVFGEQERVQAQHARDGPRCPDERGPAVACQHRKHERGDRTRAQVGHQVAEPTEAVLDVVAVDPQKQHVAAEVHQPGVHEHAREQVGHRRVPHQKPMVEHHEVPGRDGTGDGGQIGLAQLWRHPADPVHQARVAGIGGHQRQRQGDQQVHRDIERHQQPRDPGAVVCGVGGVADGQNHRCLPVGTTTALLA